MMCILLYHTLMYFLEMRFFTETQANMAVSKLQEFSCLYLPPSALTLYWVLGILTYGFIFIQQDS